MNATLTRSTTRTPTTTAALIAEGMKSLEGVKFASQKERKERARSIARGIAIFRSPIGRAALTIGNAVKALEASLLAFLEEFPDDNATEEATIAAIEAAGLMDEKFIPFDFRHNHFDGITDDLHGWLFQIHLMDFLTSQLTPPYKPFDTKENNEEEDDCDAPALRTK